MFKGYTQLSRAYYGDVCLEGRDYEDEIMIGMYAEEGGTEGEFSIKWYRLGGELVPSIEIFSDAWNLLIEFESLIYELARNRNENLTPKQLCEILGNNGFKDITEETKR